MMCRCQDQKIAGPRFRYNVGLMVEMIAKFLAPILEVFFFVGMAGSAIVIILSGVEDIQTISSDDEEPTPAVKREVTTQV